MKNTGSSAKLSIGKRLSYGCGDIACNIVGGMNTALLTLFYTDYVGISPWIVGMIMLISRIFDGFSDLAMGMVVQKTKSKWGKSRPWILWMAVPYGIAAVLMYAVPNTTELLKAVYIFVTYNCMTTVMYTMVNVPYGSLSTMMTRDPHEQDMLSVFRMMLSPIGKILSVTMSMPIIKLLGDTQQAWVQTISIWAVVAVILLLICFRNCKETVQEVPSDKPVEKRSVRENMAALVRNKYFWCCLILCLVQVSHNTVNGTSLSYYCKYIFKNDTWMYSALYFAEIVILILGAMISPFFINRIGKRNTALAGSILAIAAQLLISINPYSFQWVFAIVILRSFGVAQLSATIFGMMGDVALYGEWKNGFGQSSLIFGADSMGFKIGAGVSSAIMSSLMTTAGYISSAGAKVTQSASALDMIEHIYRFGPLVVWVISVVVLLTYKLDHELPKIIKELDTKTK